MSDKDSLRVAAQDEEQLIEKVYAAQGDEEITEIYDSWAVEYDLAVSTWSYQIKTAAISGYVGRYVTTDEPMLDAGAGTGCIGAILKLMGFSHVVGLDISAGMLEVAKKRMVYESTYVGSLGTRLPFEDDSFAASIASGVFATGHAPAQGILELLRVTRPGGYFIFNARGYCMKTAGYQETLDKAITNGLCTLVESSVPFPSCHPLAEKPEDAMDCIRVLRVS